jgi:hypothetical protein
VCVCVCVCMCVCVCARACVCACVLTVTVLLQLLDFKRCKACYETVAYSPHIIMVFICLVGLVVKPKRSTTTATSSKKTA